MIARMANPHRRQEHGFTLVELMVTLTLLALVMALAFGQLAAGVNQTADLDRGSTANFTARLVVDTMVSELRQASTSDGALTPIATMTATELMFYSPDRSMPKKLRKITYRVVNGSLQRSEALSTSAGSPPWVFPTTTPTFRTLLTGITNTNVFSYFQAGGAATTSAAEVRGLSINLIIQSSLSDSAERIYRTGIDIRSVG